MPGTRLRSLNGHIWFNIYSNFENNKIRSKFFSFKFSDKKANRYNSSIGSIAAGGRNDNLIGVFDAKGHSVPCVGISIGVERIFAILQSTLDNENVTRPANVYVISAHKGLHEIRLKFVNRLWAAGIRSEHLYKENLKILHQIQYCEKHKIPFGIIVGESEIEKNIVKLRIIETRDEIEIPIDNLENEIRQRLAP